MKDQYLVDLQVSGKYEEEKQYLVDLDLIHLKIVGWAKRSVPIMNN